MIKDFEIKDVLKAVYSISNNKKNVLTLNNEVKSSENKILVLDEMIE